MARKLKQYDLYWLGGKEAVEKSNLDEHVKAGIIEMLEE
jgi:hypothetical protein